MKNKEINPLTYDFARFRRYKFFEKSHLVWLKGLAPSGLSEAYLFDQTIYEYDLGTQLAPLKLSVNMHRIMFVGLEHHDQAKIFVKFRHDDLL